MFDVIIIGAGVIGSSIAMHLSQYKMKVLVLEKNPEACMETSKANSGIIHAGYDAVRGSLKEKLNVECSLEMEALSKRLHFLYKKIGSLLVFREDEKEVAELLYKEGLERGIPGIRLIDQEELREKEPHLCHDYAGALYAPSAAIVCPFQLTYSLLENAIQNGVSFQTMEEVVGIKKQDNSFLVKTQKTSYQARYVMNAAGVKADQISAFVGDNSFTITPRRGEYRVLDHTEDHKVKHILFQIPTPHSKGVLALPTVHGNLLLGPTSVLQDSRTAKPMTEEGLAEISLHREKLFPEMNLEEKTIRIFSGLRATSSEGDFIVRESSVPGFFHAAGIDSPGLSSAYSIGKMITELLLEKENFEKNMDYLATNPQYKNLSDYPLSVQKEMIQENPEYGIPLCRCEDVSLADVKNAIGRPLGARTIGGVKRRVRPGSGRCQGGFCEEKIAEILAQELDISLEEVYKENALWIKGDKHV